MRPGGPVVGATRLPFGWKFSPYLCQRILGDLLRRLIPQDVDLLHYLDDFVLVSTDRPLLHGTTQECVRLLVEAYVSPRALVHIWNAATAPDDRAVAALAALSWTMWLRVGEAASIRYCDLDRKEGLSV